MSFDNDVELRKALNRMFYHVLLPTFNIVRLHKQTFV